MEVLDDYYPRSENLGKKCIFWNLLAETNECYNIRPNLLFRESCGGKIDPLCLAVMEGRLPTNLTPELAEELKVRAPDFYQKSYLPHNNTT
jgi:hypothetical protein